MSCREACGDTRISAVQRGARQRPLLARAVSRRTAARASSVWTVAEALTESTPSGSRPLGALRVVVAGTTRASPWRRPDYSSKTGTQTIAVAQPGLRTSRAEGPLLSGPYWLRGLDNRCSPQVSVPGCTRHPVLSRRWAILHARAPRRAGLVHFPKTPSNQPD